MKVAAVAALAALAACAAAPPEPLSNPKRKRRPIEETGAAVPLVSLVTRPAIALPPLPPPPTRTDLTELVRWPLGHAEHPALEPAFAIARVFAQPGVSWIDLCSRGVQSRRGGGIAEAHRTYLTAWCDVLKRDAEAAIARLSPLRSTLQRGIADAVRRDIANIVVDAGAADISADLLARARIDDVEIYDLVSATYAEVGRTADARWFNGRALASSASAGRCERRAKEIVLSEPYLRGELIKRLQHEGTCRVLAADLACWHDVDNCLGGRSPEQRLHELYKQWPSAPRTAGAWWTIAYRSSLVLAVPGADQLATAALAAMLNASRCTSGEVRFAADTATQIRAHPVHDTKLDALLDQIIQTPKTFCQP